MKTIEEKARLLAKLKECFDIEEEKYYQSTKISLYYTFKAGAEFTQRFIPVGEEEMPIEEDILVITERGSVYFGKWRGGTRFYPDLAHGEDFDISIIAAWRPIFYK